MSRPSYFPGSILEHGDAPRTRAARGGGRRIPVAHVPMVVGVHLLVVSIAASFVVRQALDTSELQTADLLITDPEARGE
jgi:hypothetical protein